MHHLNQPTHHLFAGIKVGNHTVAQGTDYANLIVRLFVHQFCLAPYGLHRIRMAVERHNGGFVYHDFVIANDNRVCRTEVNSKFLLERKEV